MKEQKRITLATLKSFVRKNRSALYVKVGSRFDGMQDCVVNVADEFSPATEDTNLGEKYTLGIAGVYLVGHSRDYFSAFETDTMIGIRGSNSCGSWIVATPK